MTSNDVSPAQHDEQPCELRVLAMSLRFPEGPVALEDGSIRPEEIDSVGNVSIGTLITGHISVAAFNGQLLR